MSKCIYFTVLLIGIFLGVGRTQDIHFTQFNMSPLTLNPAHTGAFEGTARLNAIYRDQWSSFLRNQFTTPSFSIDAPIFRGIKEHHWIGVGMAVVSDKAGTGRLATNFSKFSASYHLALDKEYKNVFTLGIQGGNVERRIRLDELQFADEFPEDVGGGGAGFGRGADRGFPDKKSYMDLGLGLMWRSRLEDGNSIEVGLALDHLNRPKYNFLGQSDDVFVRRSMRFLTHATYKHQLNERVYIAPTMLFQTTGGSSEIVAQSMLGYQFNEDLLLKGGLGYRLGDAAQILLGGEYEDFKLGIAYDLNVSPLIRSTNSFGGFELAASYIVKIYKKPSVKPAILCPDF
jgi:type IX secretion system PorP/SprF family membrane protein